MEVHFDGPLLHIGHLCLYRTRVPTDDDESLLRSIGRVVAEGIDSYALSDGLTNHPRKHHFGSLLDALTVLASASVKVTIEVDLVSATPGVTQTPTSLVVTVGGSWSVMGLPPSSSHADINQPVRPVPQEAAHRYIIETPLLETLPPVLAPPLQWRTIVDSPSHVLKLYKDTHDTKGVRLYRCGILWGNDPSVVTLTICVDTHYDDDLMVPDTVTTEQADAVGDIFLHATTVPVLSKCPLVLDVLARIGARWGPALRTVWRFDSVQQMVNIVRNSNLPNEFARLIDMNILLLQRTHHERINLTGLSILRRMQTSGCSRHIDWIASIANEFAVVRFQTIPIPLSRFATLRAAGCFAHWTEPTCDYGVLLGDDMYRTVVVPINSTPASLTHALVSLLRSDVVVDTDERTEEFEFVASRRYTEASAVCSPDEDLQFYSIRIDSTRNTVVLRKDTTFAPMSSRGAISIDELPSQPVCMNPKNIRRAELEVMFPRIMERIRLANETDLVACMRELQFRRVSDEWSIEALDSGDNLSSLGMSILLGILLGAYMGCGVRVAMSCTRAATVAVYTTAKTYVLVDPTRTTCSMFHLSEYLTRIPSTFPDIRKGVLVEVKHSQKWRAGLVQRIDQTTGQIYVQFLTNGHNAVVSKGMQTWRRVSDDTSDLDRLVRNALDPKRARP